MTALIGAEVNGGNGVFAGPLPPSTIAQLVVASNVLWILIVNITKASILLQYLRIFSSRPIRRICYTFLFLLILAASWAVFAGVFLCSPTQKLWKPEIPGHCLDARTYWLSVAGIDIMLDFLILLLPLPAISGLRLPRKQKVGLILVFSLGFFVCLVSVGRLASVLVEALQGHYVDSAVWAIVWSAVEANVGIICASLLSLKPLVTRIFPNIMTETKPPPHSMQIAMIEVGDVWRDETMKVLPRSFSSRTMSNSLSKGSGDAGGLDSVQKIRTLGLSQVADISEVEPEYPPRCHNQGISIFDMLRETEEEVQVQVQVQRKNSCFLEHF